MNRAVQPQRQQRRGIFSVPLADHPDLGVTEAAGDMVVDQPTGLHKGITDCRADKLKAAFFQCLRQRIGSRRRGGNFRQRRSAGHLWRIVDEGPDKISERLAIFFHRQIGAGVADNGWIFPDGE